MESQGEDGTVGRIARAFDAAFKRFCEAKTVEGQEDETSNLLHHLYRLAVAIHGDRRKGHDGWHVLWSGSDVERMIPALIQLRHVDVHAMVRPTTEIRGVYPEFYTAMYGTLVWDISDDSFTNDRLRQGAEQYNVVETLNGKGVAGTLCRARHTLSL